MNPIKKDPLDGLNPSQVEAVKHFTGPLLILAGAGAGKTRVITHRIAYLIEGLGVMPYEILALTFTNKAAGEMRDRAERLIGDNARKVTLATFHSFCNHLLRREIRSLKEYSENFSIYDDADTRRCVKEILKELDRPMTGSHAPARIMDAISRSKNFAAAPSSLLSSFDPLAEEIDEIFKLYEARLVENNAMDFDNLLGKTLELLDGCAETRDRYRRRYQFILVDEYQDTNRVQYELLRRLCPPDGNITVVGDADQSIYGWRGADIGNMTSFERNFNNVAVVSLEQNYRSKQNILDAANALIAHNAGPREKRLWSALGPGDPVMFHLAWDDSSEAQFIVDEAGHLLDEGYRLEDIAVLFRTRAQSRPLEDAFIRAGLPYLIIGATEFYKRKEIKDAIAYLRVVDNPRDMVAFARIANEPKRGLGPKSLEKIESAAREAGSLIGISEDAAVASKQFPAKAAPLIGALRRLHGLRDSVPVPELVRAVLEDTGYYSYVERMDKQEGVSRAENLEEFFKLAHEYAKEASKPTLEGFLSKVSLVSDSDVADGDESRARMLTLHSAKGLEFPVVFIVGLEEGMLPHGNALGDADGDREERRLCYVGATRAKELLYLSACKGRMTRGVACNNDISRFIMEIGPDRFKMLEGARGGARPGESFFDTAPGGGSDEAVERSTAIRLGGADADDFSREPVDDDYSATRRASSKKSAASSRGFDSDRFDGVDEEIVREKCGFRAGDKVEHKVFGTGRVVSFKGDEICVAFENIGIKRLSARYAPLVKID